MFSGDRLSTHGGRRPKGHFLHEPNGFLVQVGANPLHQADIICLPSGVNHKLQQHRALPTFALGCFRILYLLSKVVVQRRVAATG